MATPNDYGYKDVHEMAEKIAIGEQYEEYDDRDQVYTVACLDRDNVPTYHGRRYKTFDEAMHKLLTLRRVCPEHEWTLARYWVEGDGTLEHIIDLQGI